MKIKVARLFSDWNGNQNQYLLEIMKGIDHERFSQVCIYFGKSSDKSHPLEKEGVKCYYLSETRRSPSFSLSVLKKFIRILREEKVDIIQANRHKSTFYAALAKPFVPAKIVMSHVHRLNAIRSFFRGCAYRFILSKKVDCFIGCSKAVAKDIATNYPGVKAAQVVALDNSVNAQRFMNALADRPALRARHGYADEHFVFVAVGRLFETKDHATLIKAFSNVNKAHPESRLLILGEGRLRETLEALINELGLAGKVDMPGNSMEVPQYLKACDAYVMSSVAEGMPLALMEAMASGLPCVVTDVGGMSEVITDERYGLLVPASDSESMAKGMIRLLELSEEDRAKMIKNAQTRILEHFDHPVAIKHQEKLYLDLMERK